MENDLQAQDDWLREELEAISRSRSAGQGGEAALGLRETVLDERRRAIEQRVSLAQERARDSLAEFDNVLRQRADGFRAMFDHVAGCVNAMYKAVYNDDSVCARLEAANENEPYLDDIEFDCVVSKRYRLIELLSGGEKTLAALALLFAILSYQLAPVILLDEVDAALDSENVRKLARFFIDHTEAHSNTASNATATHFIVVTHKRSMF
jgi:structural maintenance of chromosome 1